MPGQKTTRKVSHYNLTQIPLERPSQGGGKRYIPSRAKIRALAKISKSGGRARCEICKTYFSTEFLRMLRNTSKPFSEPVWVCLDCKDEHPEYRKP